MPFGRAHLLAAAALFVAFVIESWEQLALVYVSGDLGTAFGIDTGRIGWALSAVAPGMFPGSLVWGPLSDRIGRRGVCVWSLTAYGVLAVARLRRVRGPGLLRVCRRPADQVAAPSRSSGSTAARHRRRPSPATAPPRR
ncbi:MFS transporter [Streptomyces acidicola]|uniref:MFS transporter n=1 Tax=Streptomyces acidicola TaxID=2596892 RepID=UPI003425448C